VSRPKDIVAKLFKLVKEVSDSLAADIVLYHGPISLGCEHRVAKRVKEFKQQPNIALFMTTNGGLPDIAYLRHYPDSRRLDCRRNNRPDPSSIADRRASLYRP
jgi:hypothetical protein